VGSKRNQCGGMRGGTLRGLSGRGLIAAAGLCVALGGCQVGGRRLATTQPVVPRESSAELIMYISDQPFVTAEPVYRALYALAHGVAFEGEFGELAETLRADGLIGKSWGYAADRLLNRGAIGFMVCRACEIRSGVNWMLTGLGRYAWRELQYKRIAGGGGESGLMSGGEFVGLLSRAEQYLQRTGKGDVESVELERPGG